MHAKSSKSDATLKNLNSLCGVKPIFRLLQILLMLKCVHALMNIAQKKDAHLCVILWSLSNWFNNLAKLYCDVYAKYEDLAFDELNSIQALISHTFPLSWFLD
jgi:hypothetical protein